MTNETRNSLHTVLVWMAALPFAVAGAWAFAVGADPVLDPRDWPVYGRVAALIYETALFISAAPFVLAERGGR